jgi:hypothetical protein
MVPMMLVALALAVSPAPSAAEPTASLQKCLADNTTGRDRKDLAKWVFLSMAAHPEIRQYAAADMTAAVDESSRTMGALVTRLITDSCATEAKAVLGAGGSPAVSFQVAFRSLGELAMQELMADKSVTQSMGLFQRYLDQKRIADLFASASK